MHRFLRLMMVAATLTAACGGKGGPTAPSGSAGTAPAPGLTATIMGSVQGTSSSLLSASTGAALTGVTVTVMGTSVTAAVDGAGRFTLMNVPPGDVRLQLTGGGTNATVSVGVVQASQTVDVVVVVSGSSASIDSAVRSGGGEAELEGRVEALPPAMPALTFRAAGRTVRTDSATRFVDGAVMKAFSDLLIGMRVHVRGTLAGETFTATRVELQSSTIVPIEVNGTISGLTGSAAAFQFTVGSTLVRGDSGTTILGEGNAPKTFADMRNGMRVEVRATPGNGFVQATRIRLEGGESETEAEAEGTIANLSGNASAFQFTLGSTLVRGDSRTTILGERNAPKVFADLRNGLKVEVKGTRGSGFLQATRIRLEEEETEAEAEGTIANLSGSASAFQFNLGSTLIRGDARTTILGERNEPKVFADLRNGLKVEVKGTRGSGFLQATRIRLER